jgi:cytochrome c oxidase assembly protein Cox11
MKKKILNFIVVTLYYVASIKCIGFSYAQTNPAASATIDQWQSEHDQTSASIMVNKSGQSDDYVKQQLVWGQVFALLGAFSFAICNQITAYDVDLWAVGAVYFTASNYIIKRDENKMAKMVIESHKLEEAQAAANPDKKVGRSNQIKSLEKVLKVQREAIQLIKRQNQLLKNMRTIYASSLVLLAILIVLAKVPAYGAAVGVTEESIKCQKSESSAVGKAIEQVTKAIKDLFGTVSMIQSGFGIIKSFTFLNNYPEGSIHRTVYNEMKKQHEEMQTERNRLLKTLAVLTNILIPSVAAQSMSWDSGKNSDIVVPKDPKADILNTKTDVSSGSTLPTDTSGMPQGQEVKLGENLTEKSTNTKVGIKDKVDNFIEQAKQAVRDTILLPYARLGLYGLMGTVTHFGVERNDKDIRAYTEKIDHFDKQVQELKANIGQGLLDNESVAAEEAKALLANRVLNQSLSGCIKVAKDNSKSYDETCACKKDNSCIDLKKNLPKNANKQTKELVSKLNDQFNGDSSYVYDDKKADSLAALAGNAAESSMLELNQTLKSQGQKPIDLNGNIKKLMKSSVYVPKQNVASNSSNSNSKDNSSSIDYPDFNLNPSAPAVSSGGVHLQSNDLEDVSLQDIHQDSHDSVFDVISLRYKKTALPILAKEPPPVVNR